MWPLFADRLFIYCGAALEAYVIPDHNKPIK